MTAPQLVKGMQAKVRFVVTYMDGKREEGTVTLELASLQTRRDPEGGPITMELIGSTHVPTKWEGPTNPAAN